MIEDAVFSPVPEESKTINFFKALEAVHTGSKIHKLEWKDKEYYGIMDKEVLKLHKPGNTLHDWIISAGDMNGQDWIIL